MTLAEMIVWSVGVGLKFVDVENGRKVSGGSRAQRASLSMISTNMAHSFCTWLVNATSRTLEAKKLVCSAASAREKRYSARRRNGRQNTRTSLCVGFLGAALRLAVAQAYRLKGFYTGWGTESICHVSAAR